jgi:DNA-binding GntR family transcriptional regulator
MLPSTLITANSQRYRSGSTESLSEAAYRILKDKIITLELPPASLVNEARLMKQLKMGRTPIREAFQRLAMENLVVIMPRRGILVADLNITDLQKIFEVRLELEVHAARLAARRATPEQIAEMENLFADADSIIQRGDHRQLIQLDHQAHRLLAHATQNEFLEESLERLYNHVLRLWYSSLHKVTRLREAVEEHRHITEAVKARNGERAAEVMRTHIEAFQREFMDVS